MRDGTKFMNMDIIATFESKNHLEELVKEYYEYQGFFVRANVRFNKLPSGGYQGEADILAYEANTKKLWHIECSEAAYSDSEISDKAKKKFPPGLDYCHLLGVDINDVSKVFIVGQSGVSKGTLMPHGIVHKSLKEFMNEIYSQIPDDFLHEAIPENYPLLRTLQLLKWAK